MKRTKTGSDRPHSWIYQASEIAILPLLVAPLAYGQVAPPAQQLSFRAYHASGLYEVGETVGWIVSPGPIAPTYAYRWTIRRNNKEVLKEGKVDLTSGKDKIEIVGDRPEMIYVAIEPYAALELESVAKGKAASTPSPTERATATTFVGGNTGRNNGLYAVGAAVAPLKLGLSTPRPADFDAFWDAKLAAQANVPINPSLTPTQSDIPGVEESLFALDSLGSKVHGYVARTARGSTRDHVVHGIAECRHADEVGERCRGEIAIADLKAGGRLPQAVDDGGRELAADGVRSEDAGVDMQELHRGHLGISL